MDMSSPLTDENLVPSSNRSPEGESNDDFEIFPDIALAYISQILMDDDDKVDDFHDNSVLETAEKPFYEILNKKYPQPESNCSSRSPDSISCYENLSSGSGGGSSSNTNSGVIVDAWLYNNIGEGPADGIGLTDLLEGMPTWNFQKGVEEARKFLPDNEKFAIDLESNGLSVSLPLRENRKFETECSYSISESRGHRSRDIDNLDLEEGRSVKQTAVSCEEETTRSQELDEALLFYGETVPKTISDIRETFQEAVSKSSKNGKGRRRKQSNGEVVDVWTLLIQCAQMVAANDQRSTYELLKLIRQHSSPFGDGSQRLSHYFANGIEARLAGTGSEIYNSYRVTRRTATDFLKAHQLYLAACPFKKITYYFSNQSILEVSEKAARVHVVDFGINFGFQWPSLIQRLSARAGGPPKLRITGIDLPQTGFRPSERIEETGRRLADYAQSFRVPFEYKAIARKWEEVRVEDLDIEGDEVLAVNCLCQFKQLADETVVMDSPRNRVLSTIRKMNPDVFIQGVLNGSYNAPFFVTRFREALFHFSALFDMIDTTVPRENEQRLLVEREIFGRDAINVIACEGLERMERPETYKQWQVRMLTAGFEPHPLNRGMVKRAKEAVKEFHHRDFVIDDDGRWLLQGWKGRIIFAVSSWKPNNLT